MRKTYIFDFDGTLVDSMPCVAEKMLNILRVCKMDIPDGIIRTITPLGDIGTAKYFRDVLHVPLTEDEMYRLMDEYALPKYRDEIRLKDGVFGCLQALKAAGCSLNVLTASPHKMVDPCLKRLGVFELFDNVWSCDDFGMTKSQKQIYWEAVQRIGTRVSDAVFLDDNLHAIHTASDAGLYTIGVFDLSSAEDEQEMRLSSDLYLRSLLGFSGV